MRNTSILPFLFVFFMCCTGMEAQKITFTPSPGSPITVGANPNAMVIADFNRDGKLDMAVTNYGTSTINILLGQGNNQYANASGSPFNATAGPICIVTADFNNDGFLDLATADYTAGSMSIYLGNGDGTFQFSSSPITGESRSYYITLGDFNGDGKPDLAQCNAGTNSVYVMLGQGDGTFVQSAGSPITVGYYPYCVTSGDLNGDGKLDLVAVNGNGNSLSLLLGNGDGTFTPSASSPMTVGNNPRQATIADFNGDGKYDLAVTNLNANTMSILLGDGAGNFTNAPGSPIATGQYPYWSTAADFDMNGTVDLAVTNAISNTVEIFPGNGDGTFGITDTIPNAGDPHGAVLAMDLNGDNKPDIVVADYAASSVNILMNTTQVISTPLTGFTLEAPMELRNGMLYSDFVKIKVASSSTIPTSSHSQSLVGTNSISTGAGSLKALLDTYVRKAGGNPVTVVIQRENLDDYIIGEAKATNIFDIHLGVMVNVNAIVADLRKDPNVLIVNPPYILETEGLPTLNQGLSTNPYASWHITKTQAPEAWVFMQPYAATPQEVAVVDIGEIYTQHPYLQGRATPSVNCPVAYNIAHPTEVATCVTTNVCAAACHQPLAVGRDFLKVSSHGTVCSGTNNAFLEIWNMPAASRPKVINLSWVFYGPTIGSPPYAPLDPATSYAGYSSISLNLIVLEQLINSGTTVVAACGNFMSHTNSSGNVFACPNTPYCFSQRGVGYPFALPGVIGVGATSPDHTLAGNTEYGMGSGSDNVTWSQATSSGGNFNYNYIDPNVTDPIDAFNQTAGFVDLVAPGTHIDCGGWQATAPYNTDVIATGTSMASPMVAAAAASMLMVNPTLTQQQIASVLTGTADKVGYTPNGMSQGDLNSNVPFTKGYTYTSTGFVSGTLDYVMGNGRLNMLSAVMNAAGMKAGGFTMTNNHTFFPVNQVIVHNVNDQNYLTGNTYNADYEYDAELNQNGAQVTFQGATTQFEIAQDATFRINGGAKMSFTGGAQLLLDAGTPAHGTKYVVGGVGANVGNGNLELHDAPFDLTNNAYLEVTPSGSLLVDNGTLVVHAGASLHIRAGGKLVLTATGKIIVQQGGYLCIEPNAVISNSGSIDLTASLLIGVSTLINVPSGQGCLAPCLIVANTAYTGTGTLLTAGCVAFEAPVLKNVSCTAANSGSITVNVTGGTTPYTYSWSGGQVTQTINGLAAGAYTVTVTDHTGFHVATTYTIAGPSVLVLATTTTNAFCMNGPNSGSATANTTGGTLPYSYSWNNGATTQTASSLVAGTYSVVVTDAVGCNAAGAAIVINDPANPPLIATTSVVNVSCHGGNNGSGTVVVTGGSQSSSGHTIDWYPTTAMGPIANAPTAGSLTAGTYMILIADNVGCTLTKYVTINEPPAIAITSVAVNASGCTGANGSATAQVNGGTPAYIYSWSTTPAQTAQTAVSLNPGTYSVSITDNNNCQAGAMVQIGNTGATALPLTTTSVGATCFGLSNGSATANPVGAAPYTYSWSNGQTTQIINGLLAGNYYVNVSDASGKCGTATAVVTGPAVATSVDFTVTYLCSGATVQANVTGGTAPYTYSWSPGGYTTQVIHNIPTGFENVNVTDSKGCSTGGYPSYTSFGTWLPAPPVLQMTTTTTGTTGCTSGNGSATVNAVINGTAPYAYSWSNGQNGATANNLNPGSYQVTVTDANGCSANTTANVTNNNGPGLTVSHTNPTCSGGNTATATVTVYGGTAPFTYSWSNGQITATATNLGTGTYSVKVTDGSLSCNVATVIINAPTNFTIALMEVDPTCIPGNDGSASVLNTFGGTAPYTYSWSNGATTSTINNLAPATYTCTATDASGCQNVQKTIVLPAGLSFNVLNINDNCHSSNDGAVFFGNFTQIGTAPYTYSWSPGSGTTNQITGLSPGTYTLTIHDAGGCVSSASATVSQPTAVTLVTSSTNSDCAGTNGTASVIATGGNPPYTYSWNTIPVQIGATATGLSGGTYTVFVMDNRNCVYSATATVNTAGPSINMTVISQACNSPTAGSATATATGGTGAYTYSWNTSPVQNTATATNLGQGNYSATVTDAAGCKASNSITIYYPVVSISPGNPSICGNIPVDLSASVSGSNATYSYMWSPLTGIIGSNNQATITVNPATTTTYSVTVDDGNGCTIVKTVSVVVGGAVSVVSTPTSSAASPICTGNAVTLTASGGTTFTWVPPYVYSNDPIVVNPTVTTTYTVTNGACTTTFTVYMAPSPTINTVSATPTSVCPGLTSTLNVTSTLNSGGAGLATYSWTPSATLGSSTIASPIATPITTTTYTITVTDPANGCKATSTQQVAVYAKPGVSISPLAPAICSGASVNLTATGSGSLTPYSYVWTPTAGISGASNLSTVSADPSTLTTYSVTVTDGNGCTATNSVPVSIDAISVSAVPASSGTSSICSGTTVTITAAGSTGYIWTPGNQNTTSITVNPPTNSVYTVSDGNCFATVKIFVKPAPTITAVTATPPAICVGGSSALNVNATLLSGGTATYSWTPPGNLNSSTVQSPIANPGTTTNYQVSVTDPTTGCSITGIIKLVVNSNPTVIITPNTPTVCQNGTVNLMANATGTSSPFTYSWSPTAAITGVSNTATVAASPSTATTYSVNVTDANGCKATGNVNVSINGTLAVSASPVSSTTSPLCAGTSVTLTPSGGTTYSWSPGGQTGTGPLVVMPLITTTYTVYSGTCSSTITVYVSPPPAIKSITATPASICTGSTSQLNVVASLNSGGTAPAIYTWTPSASLTNSTTANPVAAPTATTTYTVTVTDPTNNCTSKATVTVTVFPTTAITVSSSNPNICGGSGASAVLTASAGYTYSWTPGISQTTQVVTVIPASTLTYTVYGTDHNGCVTHATTIEKVDPPLVLTLVNQEILCAGGNTTIGGPSFVTGGTAPYTYSWSPGGNTTSSVVVSPAVTTTYSVTVKDAAGCSSTGTVIVYGPTPSVHNCCVAANQTISASTTATILGGAWTSTAGLANLIINVGPGVTLTLNKSMNINTCTFRMGPDSKIVIQSPFTVNITGCTFFSCTNMWDGIFISQGANITSNNNVFNDSYHAMVSIGGSQYLAAGNTFDNNYIGIVDSNFTTAIHPAQLATNTFKCSGSLKAPYINRRGFAGVSVLGVTMGITVGQASSGNPNSFDGAGTNGMEYGVISDQRSIVTVYNCTFKNFFNMIMIAPKPPALPPNPTGVCILAQNGGKLTVGGTAVLMPNTFTNSAYGIIAQNNMSLVDIENNTFTAILKPSLLVNGGYCISALNSTAIKNTRTVFISNNTFTNFKYGAYTFNYIQSSVSVVGNHFTNFTGTAILQSSVPEVSISIQNNIIDALIANITKATGIQLSNPATNATGLTTVSGNDISRCMRGIYLVNYPNASIINQDAAHNGGIHFTGAVPTVNTYGIRVVNGAGTLVNSNEILYPTTPATANTLYGISMETGCAKSIVTNNLLGRMGTGMNFLNLPLNPLTVTCNVMNLDQVGLTLSSANIGNQGDAVGTGHASDDVWIIPAGAATYGTTVTGTAYHPNFFVRSTTSTSPMWFPPLLTKVHPVLSITDNTPVPNAPTNICSAVCYAPVCNYKHMVSLATMQAPFSGLTAPTLYQANQQAYAILAADTTLGHNGTAADTILVQYRDSLKLTNIGLLQVVSTSLSTLDLATAQAANNILVPGNLIEQNHKTVNAIYMRTWALGQYVTAPPDSLVLLGIAKQNVFTGGTAVYDARLMIGQDFPDPDLNRSKEEEIMAAAVVNEPLSERMGKMFPNPSNSSFFYSASLLNGESGTVELYDLLGKKLQIKLLKEGENLLEFHTDELYSGIYIYKVIVNEKLAGAGKVILTK
jgi:hypothetical protein